jgi:transcriptional regulator with XRE-family HTH domain
VVGLHFAAKLRAERTRLGLSRRELDERAGLSRRSTERYEVRGHEPDPSALHRLAEALGTAVGPLAGALMADNGCAPSEPPPSLPLPSVLDALVQRHGAEQLLTEAVAAAFRRRV